MQQRRLYIKPCYEQRHSFQMTHTKVISIKLNSTTEMNDNCNQNQNKLQIIH